MVLLNLSFLAIGIVALFYGSDWLVVGSSRLARQFKLSPLLIGLTIVAAGTSAPEFFVSVYSAWSGFNDIAIGNVLGSNIVNLGFILGILIILSPIKVKNLSFDLYFYSFVLFLLLLFVNLPMIQYNFEGTLGFSEGLIFVGILVAYFIVSYYLSRSRASEFTVEDSPSPLWKLLGLILLGLLFLALGSDFLVRGARYFASEVFDISEKVIALTLVAIGTSLPEFLTSLVATFKKELDLSIGNLIGSCIFNILGVLGASAIVNPMVVSAGFTTDFWVMVGVSALVIFPALFFKRLGRFTGFLLLGTYVIYTIYLIYAVS